MNNQPGALATPWLRKGASFVGKNAASSIVASVAFSVAFMIFNDYIFPPPNLSGRWKFTVIYEETSVPRFQDMQVTYQALLIQEGLHLTGSGEKMSAVSPTIQLETYEAAQRGNVELSGNIRRNYFSPDQLVMHYKEAGAKRESSTLHELEYFDPEAMCGCFVTTIANTRGTVWWRRVGDSNGLAEPVQRIDICGHVSCSNTP